MRFGKMETKLGLFTILRNFEILESDKNVYPPTWDPKKHPALLMAKDDIYVKLRRISEE
jgi:hypothetical protein